MLKFRDPLSGSDLEIRLVSVDDLKLVPFNRPISQSHAKKLLQAIEEIGYFLVPLVVWEKDGELLVVDGQHRLLAAKSLGLKEVPVIVVQDSIVASKILKLNTEKASNIKDKSIQAYRMVKYMIEIDKGDTPEENLETVLDFPTLITFGIILEDLNPRFPASSYEKIYRFDSYLPFTVQEALDVRKQHAQKLNDLDALVVETARKYDLPARDPFYRNTILSRALKEADPTMDLEDLLGYLREVLPEYIEEYAAVVG